MRALAISAVVGAMVLTGCQSTGNNIGGVEYDKAALGTLIGAAAGYGISKGSANTSRQNNRAAAIGEEVTDRDLVDPHSTAEESAAEAVLRPTRLADFHGHNKTTALVCHGPIALLSTLPDANGFVVGLESGQTKRAPQWIYSGYQITVISNQEEEQAKPQLGGGEMKFYPQTALQQAGVQYRSNAAPWTANVVVDRELITGQNPASAVGVAQELLKRLK